MCTLAKGEQEPDEEEKSQIEPPTFYITQRLSLPTTVRFRWLGSVFTSICHEQHIQMARKSVTKQLTCLILHQWQQHHMGPFDLCSFEVGASICAPVGCQFCVQGFGIYPSAHQSALISIILESKGFHFQHRRLFRSLFKGWYEAVRFQQGRGASRRSFLASAEDHLRINDATRMLVMQRWHLTIQKPSDWCTLRLYPHVFFVLWQIVIALMFHSLARAGLSVLVTNLFFRLTTVTCVHWLHLCYSIIIFCRAIAWKTGNILFLFISRHEHEDSWNIWNNIIARSDLMTIICISQ